MSRLLRLVSAEFILDRRANGGGPIFFRALWSSVLVIALILIAENGLHPDRVYFSSHELRLQMVDKIPWFGTVFAAIYAALYARFSAQWEYLADLYNQIKAAECARCVDTERLAEWKAAFLEDAEDLHLALKPSFAWVIKAWCEREDVRTAYVGEVPSREKRLKRLETVAKNACAEHAKKFERSLRAS